MSFADAWVQYLEKESGWVTSVTCMADIDFEKPYSDVYTQGNYVRQRHLRSPGESIPDKIAVEPMDVTAVEVTALSMPRISKYIISKGKEGGNPSIEVISMSLLLSEERKTLEEKAKELGYEISFTESDVL